MDSSTFSQSSAPSHRPSVMAAAAINACHSGQQALEEGDTASALAHFRTAVALHEKADARSSSYVIALSCLGSCYTDMNDYPTALSFVERALAVHDPLSRP